MPECFALPRSVPASADCQIVSCVKPDQSVSRREALNECAAMKRSAPSGSDDGASDSMKKRLQFDDWVQTSPRVLAADGAPPEVENAMKEICGAMGLCETLMTIDSMGAAMEALMISRKSKTGARS